MPRQALRTSSQPWQNRRPCRQITPSNLRSKHSRFEMSTVFLVTTYHSPRTCPSHQLLFPHMSFHSTPCTPAPFIHPSTHPLTPPQPSSHPHSPPFFLHIPPSPHPSSLPPLPSGGGSETCGSSCSAIPPFRRSIQPTHRGRFLQFPHEQYIRLVHLVLFDATFATV